MLPTPLYLLLSPFTSTSFEIFLLFLVVRFSFYFSPLFIYSFLPPLLPLLRTLSSFPSPPSFILLLCPFYLIFPPITSPSSKNFLLFLRFTLSDTSPFTYSFSLYFIHFVRSFSSSSYFVFHSFTLNVISSVFSHYFSLI